MDISCRGGEELDLDASSRGERHEKHVVKKALPVFRPHVEEYGQHVNTAPSSVASSTNSTTPKQTSSTPKIPAQKEATEV